MTGTIKLHSMASLRAGKVLVFSDVNETRAVGVSIPDGLEQEQFLQRIRDAFSHYNAEVAKETAA